MTSTLICNSDGIFTGLLGDAMRATGAIRILNGRIAAMGDLASERGEEVIDASGCVVYPGQISTHHHLFQSVLKGVRAGINLPLMGWLRSVRILIGTRCTRRSFTRPHGSDSSSCRCLAPHRSRSSLPAVLRDPACGESCAPENAVCTSVHRVG